MGIHVSLPAAPSIKHLEHAVSATVKSGIEGAIKDVSKSISDIAADMPVDLFLKLPLIKDITAWTEGNVVDTLAASIVKYQKRFPYLRGADLARITECWEKDFTMGKGYSAAYFKNYVNQLATHVDGRAVNLAVLMAHPIVRAYLLTDLNGQMASGWKVPIYDHMSPFTKFFFHELMKVETLVADLIPLWANLGK